MQSLIPRLTLALSLLASAPAYAQDADASVYSDWQVVCDEKQPCRMAQTVAQQGQARVILQAKVFKSDKPTLLLTFPLGILLSTGWSYQIDGGRRTVVPFEICNTSGCHAGVPLSDDMLQRLRQGSQLQIAFRDAANQTVSPVISLAGFTKAYETLK
jgi:invasion protein IalB